MPERSWCADAERRAEANVPEDLAFKTRPQQVQAMIDRTVEAGVPFAWFAADEEFGQNHKLRRHLEEQQIAYCMAVPKNTTVTTGSPSTATSDPAIIETIAAQLKRHDWQRRACGIGSKGFRVYDWAVIEAPFPGHQYVVRRNINDGELAYFHCYNPCREGLCELVRVIGSRWPIEECFEAAKQEAGLAQYQFRLYRAWYRHITLAMLAMAFLAVLRHTAKGARPCGQPAATGSTQRTDRQQSPSVAGPAPQRPVRRLISLSIAEIRRLFDLIDKDDHAVELGLYWSVLRRSHQAEARRHHFRRHLHLQMIEI